ncbi:bifunctional hydroxymethylpyrimidine kinase/phosphomethylpyrimidine kinase [Desulfovibrio inopinatus]|uniref:bifunctional hydroxymethylpyrimidine kinase/phosphomethylpyrimidine kinase n=1 Tax=Desulfovibrio inopinatus TaxID=102109 RepID=UPI00041CE9C3|nr:bifunctional hydroxymethylpyrimidine kinase/phosphomethylpyrimidine kinase [Desulfovibrio inopinatus]
MHPPCILTIAGSDSCGGAGIQADLKTIMMQGGYGLSVITALTAQNTQGVTAIHAPPADFVAKQLETVLSDIPIQAAKTGMLFSAAIITALSDILVHTNFPLVVDPVCVSQSGHQLMQSDAISALKERLIPRADLLTPNRHEAELLSGIRITDAASRDASIQVLLGLGAKAVLLKGGHFDEETDTATDWLAVGDKPAIPLQMPRIATKNAHGTGCTLSAAIASWLGRGLMMEDAIRRAQAFLNLALSEAFDLGAGSGPPNHLAPYLRLLEKSSFPF